MNNKKIGVVILILCAALIVDFGVSAAALSESGSHGIVSLAAAEK